MQPEEELSNLAAKRATWHQLSNVASSLQAEAYMSLGEWEKAEILLHKLLETDLGSATVALYQLSQVCMHVHEAPRLRELSLRDQDEASRNLRPVVSLYSTL